MDMPTWQVVALGFGTVFVVLVCIILLCKVMSFIISKFAKAPAPVQPVVSAPVSAPINTDKQQILVAISVAIAEQVGVDVSRIRIHSINKV